MKKLIRLLRHDWRLHMVLTLTNWLPDSTPFLRLRGWLATPCFASCGGNLRLGRNLTFYNPSRMVFGRDVYVAQGCWFMAGEDIVVEDEVLFGPYCVVVSANHTLKDGSFRFGPPATAPVRVGAGSWLASHVTVSPGSVVGHGSLVGANSVVTGTFPAHSMVGGVPGRQLRSLTE